MINIFISVNHKLFIWFFCVKGFVLALFFKSAMTSVANR